MTFAELTTVHSLQDLWDVLEINAVNRHNEGYMEAPGKRRSCHTARDSGMSMNQAKRVNLMLRGESTSDGCGQKSST